MWVRFGKSSMAFKLSDSPAIQRLCQSMEIVSQLLYAASLRLGLQDPKAPIDASQKDMLIGF